MRTAILIGLISVANAINPTWASNFSQSHTQITSIIILVCMIMDIIDFARGVTK